MRLFQVVVSCPLDAIKWSSLVRVAITGGEGALIRSLRRLILRANQSLTVILYLTILLVLLSVTVLLYQIYENSSATSPAENHLYDEAEQKLALAITAGLLELTVDESRRLNTGDCELLSSVWIEFHGALVYADIVLGSYKAKPLGLALTEIELAISRLTNSFYEITYACNEE